MPELQLEGDADLAGEDRGPWDGKQLALPAVGAEELISAHLLKLRGGLASPHRGGTHLAEVRARVLRATSFPPEYVVDGRPRTKTVVGNAVPPLLAAAIAGAQFAPSPASSRAA